MSDVTKVVVVDSPSRPVLASVGEYRGRKRFDLRQQYFDQAGAMCPTRRGISILLEGVPALLAALEEAGQSPGKLVEADMDLAQPVMVRLAEYQGRMRLDVRHYYQNGEEWSPTQKGVNVAAEALGALLEAVRALVPAEA